MSRGMRAHEITRRAKALRDRALARVELRQPSSSPRDPASGPTSMAVKARDPADAILIEAYLRQRGRDK